MRVTRISSALILIIGALAGCSGNRLDERGLQVSQRSDKKAEQQDGISGSMPSLPTRPSNVLLTGIPRYRIATIYKINYARDSSTFIGSNDYYLRYDDIAETSGNQWNYNFLPGLEAVYGYNMVNVSHYDTETNTRKDFFEQPVLINTLYYPSFSKDTLNYKPVNREYFMVSAYDEDTNKDGYINARDLRRFYMFDIHADNRQSLVAADYSVFKCEYDPANDFIHVFARLDENRNGMVEQLEPVHIFWVDLKNPQRTGREY